MFNIVYHFGILVQMSFKLLFSYKTTGVKNGSMISLQMQSNKNGWVGIELLHGKRMIVISIARFVKWKRCWESIDRMLSNDQFVSGKLLMCARTMGCHIFYQITWNKLSRQLLKYFVATIWQIYTIHAIHTHTHTFICIFSKCVCLAQKDMGKGIHISERHMVIYRRTI